MRKIKVWMNGKAVDIDKAKISIFDRGFLYGDGLFETMRSYSGKTFKTGEHMTRLFNSSRLMKIKIPYSSSGIEKAIRGLLKINGIKDASIRITATRGEGFFSLERYKQSRANVVITVREFNGYPERFYSRGITAEISRIRQNEYSPSSSIKTLNFLNYILARYAAQDSGYDEAILVNMKNNVAEAAASNIFLAKDNALFTPSLDSGILPGVTRSAVIGLAKKLGIKVSQKAISRKELAGADEVFLTSSLAEVLPVVKIGRAAIGSGRPGKITKLLHAAYRKMVLLRSSTVKPW
jgi:branched-chain amino acid aminotransferase